MGSVSRYYSCKRVVAVIALAAAATLVFADSIHAALPTMPVQVRPISPFVQAKTCKQVHSCEEAVELWCGGYRRADRDGDGIPCENICYTKEQVDEIRRRIGC